MIGGKTFVYNTSTVYNNKGELIAKHRKVCDKSLCRWGFQGSFVRHQRSWRPEVLWEWHSDSGQPPHDIQLSMGKNWIRNLLWYPIPWVEVWSSYVWGRLWGSSMLMTKEGCRMLIFPSAFNTTTGMHLRKKPLFFIVDVDRSSPLAASGSFQSCRQPALCYYGLSREKHEIKLRMSPILPLWWLLK